MIFHDLSQIPLISQAIQFSRPFFFLLFELQEISALTPPPPIGIAELFLTDSEGFTGARGGGSSPDGQWPPRPSHIPKMQGEAVVPPTFY